MTFLERWEGLIGAAIGVLVAYLLFSAQRRIDQNRSETAVRAKFQPSIEIAEIIAESLNTISQKVAELSELTANHCSSVTPAPHSFHQNFDEQFNQIGSEIKVTEHRISFLDETDHQGCNVNFFEAKHALKHLVDELSSIFSSTRRIYESSGGLNSTTITKHHAVCGNLVRLKLPIMNNKSQTSKMKKSLENAIKLAVF